jgi:hypothetical protein
MNATAVAAMLDEDRREWAALCAMLDAHPEGALHDPESPAWTARDVYTHIAAMMEGSARLIEEYLAGQPHRRIYEGADEDDTNARIQQEHSDMSFQEARAWAQRAFEALITSIEGIPLDRWDKRFEFYARADGAEHFRGHMSYITT